MRLLKKYPNRRIYDTEDSCYITLADVRRMVIERQPFQVLDSRGGNDITRSVLLQVIADMEAEGHQSLLTNRVLEELIRFYGDRMVGMLGPFLERQVLGFLAQQDNLRRQLRGVAGSRLPLMPVPGPDELIETLTQQYQNLLKPFTGGPRKGASERPAGKAEGEKKHKTSPRRGRDGKGGDRDGDGPGGD